jgi:adenosylcobinamide-GDP ribazoletransferase
LRPLALCFGLLTVLPVGGLPTVDRRTAGAAMLLAPLAAVPLAALAVGAHLLVVHTGIPVALLAVLLLVAEAVLTRALHLDGLADTVDGLGSGKPAAEALRVMKASDIGPFGALSIVLVLLLQLVALLSLLPTVAGTTLLVVAWLTSRQVLAWACREGVPAASEGLGALVAGSVPVVAGAVSLCLAALAAAACVLLEVPGWWALVVVAAGVLAAVAVVRRCEVRLGGVTGDVLGAVVEAARTVALVTAVVLVTA